MRICPINKSWYKQSDITNSLVNDMHHTLAIIVKSSWDYFTQVLCCCHWENRQNGIKMSGMPFQTSLDQGLETGDTMIKYSRIFAQDHYLYDCCNYHLIYNFCNFSLNCFYQHIFARTHMLGDTQKSGKRMYIVCNVYKSNYPFVSKPLIRMIL